MTRYLLDVNALVALGFRGTPSALVKMPKDGHLVQLARENGAVLATLDRNIPGAFGIPKEV